MSNEPARGPEVSAEDGPSGVEARERQFDDVVETIRRVHDAATPDGYGTVKCARCLGTVRYEKKTLREKRPRRSRQGPARGVWSRGQCNTEGCIGWIV